MMFAHPGRVVTKFQFSSLFRQAWSKGMSIDNICAGFKQTGVYPLNPEAILKECSESISSVDDSEKEPASGSASSQFSPEQLARFEERYANKYDIFTDHDYVIWLQEFHPESVPSIEAMLGLETDGDLLSGADSSFDDLLSGSSSLLAPGSSSSSSFPSDPGSTSKNTRSVSTPHSSENCLTGSSRTPTNSLTSAPQSASKSRSVFADILNLPNQTPTGRRKIKAVSGARVLTSIEARRILEEKEHKKKEELEEKERKKQEREQKKLQRQEGQRKNKKKELPNKQNDKRQLKKKPRRRQQ